MSHPDQFQLFHLPAKFALDRDALDRAFRSVQSSVHGSACVRLRRQAPRRDAVGDPARTRPIKPSNRRSAWCVRPIGQDRPPPPAGDRHRSRHHQSLVATVQTSVVLDDAEGRSLLPSIVRYGAGDDVEVGYAAQKQQAVDPRNTIVSVKRFMGRTAADVQYIESMPYDFVERGISRTAAGIAAPWRSRPRSCARCAGAPRKHSAAILSAR
jgi:hypothetical protein